MKAQVMVAFVLGISQGGYAQGPPPTASSRRSPPNLESTIRQLSGTVHLLDCGSVRRGDDPTSVNECILKEFVAGQPFKAVYRDIRFRTDKAVVSTREGVVYEVFESFSDGGVKIGTQVELTPCSRPISLKVEADGRVGCVCSSEPNANVQVGQSRREVEDILGPPKAIVVAGDRRQTIYYYRIAGCNAFHVTFLDGIVSEVR